MHPYETHTPLSERERFAALNRIGAALLSEHNEQKLLQLIAQTAADVIGAHFSAFSLRPTDEQGELLGPSEGHLFHLAAVVGVTEEQQALFQRLPLGGEGLLAPIFRYGVPVRVGDVLKQLAAGYEYTETQKKAEAQQLALAYAHGYLSSEELRAIGMPEGHPLVRSFLGVPLLDHAGNVHGGLLLGHREPDRFQAEDEELLVGLANQAAIAIENARLYQAIHTRAQELDAIFQSIQDGVTLLDPQQRIVRENKQAYLLRTRLEQSPQGQQSLEELLYAPARHALTGYEKQDISVTIINECDEKFEYIVNASALYQQAPATPNNNAGATPSISGAVIVWHDVTEVRALLREKHDYAEIEARRSLLQRILDELPTGVYLVHGHDARLVLANQTATTLWGATWLQEQSMLDFLQQHHIQIFRNDGRILPVEELATLRAVQRGETIYQRQEIIRHADGSSQPVLVNAITLNIKTAPLSLPIVQQNEHDPVAIVVHQDVSALKEAENLKDDFISIAAHELRNPLAALQGFIELFQAQLARQQKQLLTQEQQESLQHIDQATQRLVTLTNDLLDVTRLQAGRLELVQEVTDLVSLVKRVTQRYQIIAPRHQLIVTTQVPFLIVSIDVMRTEQVLTNLLSNAIKYSPCGGQIQITLEKQKASHQALLKIKDTGIGIPAYQQAQIFGRFTRAANAQAHGIYGTGLGLYLSRELVERQGGNIWFQSQEGQGTTFFITLPLIASSIENDILEENTGI
ncbi:sensor histidine kinase [Dictyobacter formicarum]|uniref:histidine kinase n=1 Tax=Dictyobacter formicarum TaxID=2778368 RepID=A0ABQ3VE48_9CHLR|nr:ATP-binding protein [Dictyobacter formicarum]GHO84432.1 histidine kinase [Dictyobacter formicarum]